MPSSADLTLVLFDLDGTLVDGQHSIIATFEAVMPMFGYAPPSHDAIRAVVGRSLPLAIADMLGPEAPVERMTAAYKDYFHKMRSRPGYSETIYDGVDATLRKLGARDDLLLGTATGKALRGIRWLIEGNGWEGVFTTLQGADTAASKPSPEMVLNACRETGVPPERTVVFGDSIHDMQMARAAGAHAVGVSWGYGAPEALLHHGAARIIDAFPEVEDAIAAFRREVVDA
jgi:phosphoglycolate phosphatase